ncbi:unnamed protein product [Zymoseptoria tritici ST99CH_3D7]|uniref:Uncharacterized protein n=2 Tax=Zymoseptoria tritici TaxID=1047171 RepID=A0A1X7RE43_ZYMT9|nr:unnamed protein product [Zymoseptoria tritici ST99CH_3D7]SMR42018.1 unnamed protein product [Zymoseptoria tritici ST99CH_1E4]
MHIVLLGTCDTKLDELLYLRSQILGNGDDYTRVTFVDVGRSFVEHEAITVTQKALIEDYAPAGAQNISSLPRGDVIKYMISCASSWLLETYQAGLEDPSEALHAIISIGGTGGTSLASGVMRDVLPIGFPKLIISTAASGDTGPIVGESDITLMYSVVDIAGTNSLLRRILSNAAGSVVGMAKAYEHSLSQQSDSSSPTSRKRIGITMFGVTTPGVDAIRKHLEQYNLETFVFHCTGHGGKAMERLIQQGELDAVIDLTTTEIADHLCGGVMSAGESRLEAALKAGIPYIISLGATDMVNFGPRPTVPEKFNARKLFEHNPTVTLMRTSPNECREIGEFIVEKIMTHAADRKKVQVVLPKAGVSMIATPGGPFYDAEADGAIFAAVRDGLSGSGVVLREDDRDVNHKGFAIDVAEQMVALLGLQRD